MQDTSTVKESDALQFKPPPQKWRVETKTHKQVIYIKKNKSASSGLKSGAELNKVGYTNGTGHLLNTLRGSLPLLTVAAAADP